MSTKLARIKKKKEGKFVLEKKTVIRKSHA